MVFPMAAIKRNDTHGGGLFDKAPHVDVDAVGVRSRDIKRLDAANTTERVLRDARIEGVGRKMVSPTNQLKRRSWYDEVKKAGHGAVAVFNFEML